LPENLTAKDLVALVKDEIGFESTPMAHALWRSRPSRLPNILETYDRSDKLAGDLIEHEINRLPNVFQANFYAEEFLCHLKHSQNGREFFSEAIQHQIRKKINSMPAGVSVPIIIRGTADKRTPLVSFSSFSEISEISEPDISRKFKTANAKIQKLLDDSFSIKHSESYILDIARFADIEGESFEMGLFVQAWLAFHGYPKIGSICCTGRILKNGEVGEVEPGLKIEAALKREFDFCLVPLGNIDDHNYWGNPRIVGFSHIEELNIWLKSHTGHLPAKNEIRSWLFSNMGKPAEFILNSFFQQMIEETGLPAKLWKNMLGAYSSEEKCRKLALVSRQFLKFLLKFQESENQVNVDHCLRYILPDDWNYALLLMFLLKNYSRSLVRAENIYRDFADALLDANLEIANASEKVKIFGLEFLLNDHDFQIVRRRYPLALCLLYRNPAELLWLLSSLDELTVTESRLLEKLLEEYEKRLEEFADDPAPVKVEAEIMQQVNRILNASLDYKIFDNVPNSNKISRLYLALKNFRKRKNKKAAIICRKLLENIITSMTKDSPEKKNEALQSIDAGENKFTKSKDPRFDKLEKALKPHYTTDLAEKPKNGMCIKSFEQSAKIFIENLLNFVLPVKKETGRQISHDMAWFPQPAIAIIMGNSNLKLILNSFFETCSGPGYESQKFKGECLAHWCGFRDQFNRSLIRQENLDQRFKIPYLCGYFSQEPSIRCDPSSCELRRSFNKNKLSLQSFFFWVKLTAEKCRICLDSEIKILFKEWDYYYKNIVSSDLENEKFKQYLTYLFLKALFINDTKENWQDLVEKFKSDPHQVRRTAQLLIPIYQALKNSENARDFLEPTWGMNNNSNFVVQYLLTFNPGKSLELCNSAIFAPIEWQMSVDQQMFHTICLSHLENKNSELRGFILEKVEDLPNLVYGLSLLHKRT